MIETITPPEAWKMLEQDNNAVLLDVRTTMEFEYIGHPIGAIHVPLMEAPAWQTDPDFCRKVREALHRVTDTDPQELTILALCRSGKRSETAAELLAAAGFNSVYNVIEGFEGDRDEHKHRSTLNGWRFHDLPWEQS